MTEGRKGKAASCVASSGASAVEEAVGAEEVTRFVLLHGDKGGVGKSTTAMVLADSLMSAGVKVAVMDADISNPDVARMFADSGCPRTSVNLRSTDGWMDAMDFVHQHPGYTFVLSMPAGIGDKMQHEFSEFVRFLKSFDKKGRKTELVMWWVINLFADSINLLERALQNHGDQFDQVVVVRNLIYGEPEKFILWNESPMKAALEKKGVLTVNLPALHLRVTQKLMAPTNIMPFSAACDPLMSDQIGFLPSEAFKLKNWLTVDVPTGLGQALEQLKA